MNRTYELTYIADPRLSDEEAVALCDDFRELIVADGTTTIAREESWGKRKMAYPIRKFNEGRYHVFFIDAQGQNTLADVAQRMRQNDKVLRSLTVRTDLDLKRAASKGKEEPAEDTEEAAEASTTA